MVILGCIPPDSGNGAKRSVRGTLFSAVYMAEAGKIGVGGGGIPVRQSGSVSLSRGGSGWQQSEKLYIVKAAGRNNLFALAEFENRIVAEFEMNETLPDSMPDTFSSKPISRTGI